jgi:hypothetical protein
MKELTDNQGGSPLATADNDLETRMFRVMIVSVIAGVAVAVGLAPWRITTGLFLGGVLSLFNYHWLRSSVGGLIAANTSDKTVGHSASRYVLRYAVIGVAVFGAYNLGLVSLPATLIGLCSFVPALFVEAFRQFYLVIIHKEGIS